MNHREIVKIIKENFDNEYNSIPSGFNRFRGVVTGIVKGELHGLTGSADSGKSAFINQFFVRNPLQFVKEVNDPSRLDTKIFVVTLQKSVKAWRFSMISSMLFEDYQIEIPPRQLMSIMAKKDRKLNTKIIGLVEKYDKYFEYFDSKVSFIRQSNPREIEKVISEWNKEHYVKTPVVDASRVRYDSYTPINKNMFPVFIIDQLTEVSKTFDPETKQPLDDRSTIALMVQYMRTWCDDYGYFCLAVHPQVADKERVESDFMGKSKEEKVEPSYDGLLANKTVGSSYNLLMSLFTPYVYNIKKHRDYNIMKLKSNFVGLRAIVGDFVGRNARVGLWFNGAVGHFEELPRADYFDSDLEYDEYIRDKQKGVVTIKDDNDE